MRHYLMDTLILVCSFCSCLSAVHAADIPPPAHASAQHIHSDQLRRIMLRLDELAYEREYTELGLDRLRAEQIELLVSEAHNLLLNAGRLPEILTAGQLTAVEQATFLAVARQLHAETLRIQADVRAYNFESLPAAYLRLHHTCNACHSLFRDDE